MWRNIWGRCVKMTDYRKIFVDTAPFIYYIEENPQYFNKVKDFFAECYQNDVAIVSSVVTVEEYCVFPYRNNKMEYVAMFEKLVRTLRIELAGINETTAKRAAQIRAEYRHFKAMDALQLAVASLRNCDLFLTNDRQLRQAGFIKCITVDEL